MSKKINTGNDGFTLIEVIISLAIFAIGFLAVASMQYTSSFGNRNSFEATEASAIAADRMEELMILPFDHTDLDPLANPHQVTQDKYDIQWQVTMEDLNADGIDDAKAIELAVTWNRVRSNPRSVDFAFIRHNI